MFGRNTHNMDSAYAVPVTNYTTSILSHQYNLASNDAADVVQEKNKYKVYFHEIYLPNDKNKAKTLLPTLLSKEKVDTTKNLYKSRLDFKNRFDNPTPTEMPEIKGGNDFQSEFADTTPAAPRITKKEKKKDPDSKPLINIADSSLLTEITDSAYLNMKPTTYRHSYKPDFVSIRLDNSILFSQYQSYTKDGGQYQNPSLGTLTTLSLNELMEDHRFTGGFQLPINLSSSAYFIQYQNFKHMVDWSVLFMHTQSNDVKTVGFVDQSGNLVGTQDYTFNSTMDMLQADFNYPLSRVRSIKFHTCLRQEKLVPKSVDTISLQYLDQLFPTQYWSLSRLEYVFDNTISPTDNIRFGSRYKVYGEYMYELNNNNQNCYNFGLDFRNYKKLYKNVIWANRVAYAHSDGNSEVQYQMGGVDNWIGAKQANSGATVGNPGFIALSTNLRGYYQGARKGNNFALLNSEIRLPILTTFMRRPIQSPLLKNLQLVGFVDAGSAWNGFLPNAEATSSTYYYPTMYSNPSPSNNNYLKLTVPGAGGLGLGYGAGLRTVLLGYFLRFDAAWSIDDLPKKPILYFSMGTDF